MANDYVNTREFDIKQLESNYSRSSDSKVKMNIVITAAEIYKIKSKSLLINALADSDSSISDTAKAYLIKFKDGSGNEYSQNELRQLESNYSCSSYSTVRMNIVITAAEIYGIKSKSLLINALADSDPFNSNTSRDYLIKFKDGSGNEYGPVELKQLESNYSRSSDSTVRMNIVIIAAEIYGIKSKSLLINALADSDSFNSGIARDYLIKFKYKSENEFGLIELKQLESNYFHSSDSNVKMNIVITAAEIYGIKSKSLLINALADLDPSISDIAKDFLIKFNDFIESEIGINDIYISAKYEISGKVSINTPTENIIENPYQLRLDIPFPETTEEENPQNLLKFAKCIDIILLTANGNEKDAVIKLLKPLPNQEKILKGCIGAETYYIGMFGEFKTVVTKCEMGALGSGAAILAATDGYKLWLPRAIIMIGVAFGKDPSKQKIGDVLVSSQIISYEPARIGMNNIQYRGAIAPSNPTLLNRFSNVDTWKFLLPDGTFASYEIGPILSGEKLIDEPNYKAFLVEQFPQAIGGEMEGTGLFAASNRVGLPWILVKSICDWADGKKDSKSQPIAAAAATSLVHYVLSSKSALDGLNKPLFT